MAVKIRLARFGCGNRPFYRIVVPDDKTPRDGKQHQVLGFYDPIAGVQLLLRFPLYWRSVGAQPSDPVRHSSESRFTLAAAHGGHGTKKGT